MSFIMRWVVIGLAVFLLGGCDTLTSIHQIGQPATEEQAKALEGQWCGSGNDSQQVFTIKHIKANELCAAGLEWNDKEGRFEMKQWTFFLTTEQDVLYVNMADLTEDGKPKPGQPQYLFVRLATASHGGAIVFYPPNPDVFVKAIETGALKGTVVEPPQGQYGKIITIEAAQEQWDQFIDPLKVAEQFDVNHPVVWIRQSKPDKQEPVIER